MLGEKPKSLSLLTMIDIRDCTDSDGVLTIPENISIANGTVSNAIEYSFKDFGENAFEYDDAIKKIILPASIKSIKWGFYRCDNFTAFEVNPENTSFCSVDGVLYSKDKKTLIIYPIAHGKEYDVIEGVKKINNKAFRSSIIEKVRLPESLEYIGANAFHDCKNLKELNIPDGIIEIEPNNQNIDIDCFYKGDKYKYNELANKLRDKKILK